MARSRSEFTGYVKVELLSRSPRRWGWRVCKEGTDFALAASEPVYFCAEDAWSNGRQVLTAIERGEFTGTFRSCVTPA